jgi:hypothetical protein
MSAILSSVADLRLLPYDLPRQLFLKQKEINIKVWAIFSSDLNYRDFGKEK